MQIDGGIGQYNGWNSPWANFVVPEYDLVIIHNLCLSRPQLRNLANLEPDPVVEESAVESNHNEPPERREPTPRQLALWKAVQQARVQGLALREIARQFGVSRNTVRKYARSLTLPTNRPHNGGRRPSSHQPANPSD